jgi:cytochrome c5
MKRAAVSFALALYIGLSVGVAQAGEESIRLEDGPGHDLTAARCAMCHSLDYIPMNAPVMDSAGWHKTVQKMIDRFGAPISAPEAREIVEYLSSRYSRR